jgi:hypothetical protein
MGLYWIGPDPLAPHPPPGLPLEGGGETMYRLEGEERVCANLKGEAK